MKTMIINETNRQKIEARIDAAQARARERLINYDQLLAAINKIEGKLNITKKALEGTRASVDIHAQDFARAYKYRAESTHVEIIYSGGKWRLISVSRQFTRRHSQKYLISLSDTAAAAILDNAACLA